MVTTVSPQTNEKTRKVFCIDDHPVAQKMLAKACHSFDATIHSNPMTATEAIIEGGHQVIVLDIVMPGVSGLEIIQNLQRAGHPCICIILSGHVNSDYAEEALSSGLVWKYHIKPIDLVKLQTTISEAFEIFAQRYS